jgi:ABC-type transport system involved in multi-copper enzyme maturation permease subunit
MGAQRADLQKLLGRGAIAVVVAWFIPLSALASFYSANAHSQLQIAETGYEQIANPSSEEELCQFLGEPVGVRCDERRREELGFARDFLKEVSVLYPLGRAAQDPLAVGGIVAGLMASLLGFVVVGGVAAAHVAGEWNHGTVKPLLARDPRRIRFVVSKFVTTWTAGIGLLAIGWAGMASLTPLFRQQYDVPPDPPGFSPGEYAGGQLVRAVIVIGVIAALGTAAGVLVRNPLGSFGLVLGIVFVSLAGAAWRSTFKVSVGYWVAAWMRFRPDTSWGDHLWVDRFPVINPDTSFHPDPWMGFAGLVFTIAVAVMIACYRMVRSEVGG